MFKNLLLEIDYESLNQFNIDIGFKIAECIVKSETTDITYIIKEPEKELINTTMFSFNNENNIHFTDNASLIFFISEFLVSKLSLEQLTNHKYFGNEFWNIQRLDHILKEVCSLPEHVMYQLSKNYKIDIPLCIMSLSDDQNNWANYNTFFNVLPNIYADNNQLFTLIDFFYEKLKNGAAPSSFNQALELIASKNSTFAREVMSNLNSKNNDSLYFFAPSIICGYLCKSTIEEINNLMKDFEDKNNPKAHEVVIASIGLLVYENNSPEYIQFYTEHLDQLGKQKWNHTNPKLMWAYSVLYQYDKTVLESMEKMLDDTALEVIDEFSRFLFRSNEDDFPIDKYKKMILNLTNFNLKATAILNCDSIMYRLLETDQGLIDSFLSNWIRNHNINYTDSTWSISKCFKMFFQKFSKNDDALMSRLTKWIVHNNYKYQAETSFWLQEISINNSNCLELDLDILNKYTAVDFIFAARKITVLAVDYRQMCNLLYSMRKYQHLDIGLEDVLKKLFKEYVIFNYPRFTNSFFNDKLKTATAKEVEFINDIQEHWNSYYSKLKSLSILKEAKVSDNIIRYYNKQEQKRMNRLSTESSNKSPLQSLFSTVTLKYGKAWAYQYEGDFSDASGMHHSSFSTEMPRGYYIDPLSFQYHRMVNINLRKEDITL